MGFTPICTEINLKSDLIFSFKKYFMKVKKKMICRIKKKLNFDV